MSKRILLLLAVPLLLSSCENVLVTQVPKTPPPVQLASRGTIWGEMPTYDNTGQFFTTGTPHNIGNAPAEGTVKIDVLVNRDGSVRAAAVTESSGNMNADHAAIGLYWNARYSLKLADTDPAPYVVTQTITLKMVAQSNERVRDSTDYGRDYNYGPTYTEGNNTGNTNTVNGFVR